MTLAAGNSFHLGIVTDDLVHFGELSVNTIWYSWIGTVPIFTDAAVIEHTNVLPAGALVHGDFWFHFHTSHEDSFVIDPTLDPEALDFAFREPSALDEPELRDLVASLIPLPATIFTLAPALVGLIALTRKRV